MAAQGLSRWLLLLLLCVAHARGEGVRDGGGRDVSVAMFSTHVVRGVTLTPVAAGAWTATCAGCARVLLNQALTLSGRVDVYAGGDVRVTAAGLSREAAGLSREAAGLSRAAAGLWHVRGDAGGYDVVLTMPSERYVAAVLNAEAASDEPAESLRALAVVARTYALQGRHYAAGAGHLAAALCDSTQCMAMRLGPVRAAIQDAVRATSGETVWAGAQRADVYFSEHCGGVTEDGGRSYLRSHVDAYCVRRGAAAWHARVTLEELHGVAQREGWRLPDSLIGIEVLQRSTSRRVLRVALRGAQGRQLELTASALRLGIGRALGWDRVRSDLYEVAVRDGAVVFDGRGYGHGIGLCQAGAMEMALQHHDLRQIVAFYFAGTVVRVGPLDEGWHEAMVGGVRVRSVRAVDMAGDTAGVREAWADALRRFAVVKVPQPLVVFAPSTEMFRQMTTQPGTALASTSGTTVVMQPQQVTGAATAQTLRHEMLHVLVESEASAHAPLWLREGLVEVLARDAARGGTSGPQREHDAAAERVRGLVARYGMAAVRGWLRSGTLPEH